MTRPRKALICTEDTPYYHVVSRCVRRSFLCGIDHTSGKSYEHRRQWIENRIRILASLFSIEILSYAVMSNHFHLVLKLNPDGADSWTDAEVIKRWTSIYKGPLLLQRWQVGEPLSAAEQQAVSDYCGVYRNRLSSLSWFMKCLNEPIARQANKEDGCTGHFWEARFKSQALLTEESVLSCMAYVDLNPVRAGMTETPEDSDHTSIQERIKPRFDFQKAIRQQIGQGSLREFDLPLKPLLHFEGGTKAHCQSGILFSTEDYLQLIDYTGRIIRPDKRGTIPCHQPPILQRLNLEEKQWLDQASHFEKNYYRRSTNKRSSLKDTG